MGTPLGPKYIPYTYMDPLGLLEKFPASRKPGNDASNSFVRHMWRTVPCRTGESKLRFRIQGSRELRDLGLRDLGVSGFRV